MSADRREAMILMAWLYHVDHLTQEEIAARLGISRSTVSRALTQAEAEGIVEITITEPLPESARLEHALRARFPRARTFTVGHRRDGDTARAAAARAAATTVERLVAQGPMTIAVGWGMTLHQMALDARPRATHGITIVDAAGNSSQLASVEATAALARAFGARAVHVPAPGHAETAELASALLGMEAVQSALTVAREADAIIVSIGTVSDDSTLVRSGVLSTETLHQLRARGAVGDILGHFIDAEGREVDGQPPLFISLTLDELLAARRVIGVAAGVDKVPAIRAALDAGLIDTLVTEVETAEALVR